MHLKLTLGRFLGFVGASLLDFDVEIWTVKLTKQHINAFFAEMELWKKFD